MCFNIKDNHDFSECTAIFVILAFTFVLSRQHNIDIKQVKKHNSGCLFNAEEVESNDLCNKIGLNIIDFQEHAFRKGFQLKSLDKDVGSVSDTRVVLLMDYRSKVPTTKSRLGLF